VSLKVYENIEQRSPEWYEARRGMVTASVVGQLITPKTVRPASNDYSRALTAQLVAERITGWVEPSFQSHDMLRGVLDEPVARKVYAETYAPVAECGFMVRSEDGWTLGWSPDGLVGEDGAVEIKCPRAKEHVRTVLADEVPIQYMPQCQAALLVSGREWLDFVSFCGGMQLWTKRVLPDERWAAAIIQAITEFETTAAEMVAEYAKRTDGLPMTERTFAELVV
jgi:putative phage-type endonuclease